MHHLGVAWRQYPPAMVYTLTTGLLDHDNFVDQLTLLSSSQAGRILIDEAFL